MVATVIGTLTVLAVLVAMACRQLEITAPWQASVIDHVVGALWGGAVGAAVMLWIDCGK